MRRLLQWFRRCSHEWENTGVYYTDREYGFTVTLKQCVHCHQTLVVYA